MKWAWIVAAAAVLCLDPASVEASPAAGEQYEITRSYETSQQSSDGSSGSSSGSDSFLERVIGARDVGLELEYDLPQAADAEDRARHWQFPARVLMRPDGTMLLINRSELEGRLQRWLAAAGWRREVCGRWIFTWNAFRIECDPQSVIETIEDLNLRTAHVREGTLYRDSTALAPGALARIANGPEGARFAALLEIDPDAVRRARAESDVAVGEIMQTPVTIEAALLARARESVSGTIEVTFDINAAGDAWRRTRVTRLEITMPDGGSETSVATDTLERRLVSGVAAHQ